MHFCLFLKRWELEAKKNVEVNVLKLYIDAQRSRSHMGGPEGWTGVPLIC